MEIYVNLNSGRKAIMKRKSARQVIKKQFGSAILSANTLLMMSVIVASTGFALTYSARALATACPGSPVSGTSNTPISDGVGGCDITINLNATLSTGASTSVLIGGSGTSFSNFGVITSSVNSVYLSPSSPANNISIYNAGTISTNGAGQSAINIYGSGGATVESFINTGTISSALSASLQLAFNGQITTLTNTGTLSGEIISYGLISTINNLQGAVSQGAGSQLTANQLPTNYNLISYIPSVYGKFKLTTYSGSTTNFGIYSGGVSGVSASVLQAGTYLSVLEGFSLSNLVSTSGTYGAFNWSLVNTSGSIWDLIVSSGGGSGGGVDSSVPTITNIATGGTFSLASIGVTANPVFDGGVLSLASGNSSAQAFTVNSAGGTIQSPTSGSATLSGVMSGVGSLTFTGTGTTVMTGANSYTGGTTVSSGTLSVAGTSPTGYGDVTVNSGATLMGTGTINGNILVAGTLKPGNSPGYLASTGNVTMATGSTYQQDIAGTTQANSATPVGATGYYSYLNVVGGQFIINSGATLAPRVANLFASNESGYGSAPYAPVLGDRFRIVSADGGISGKFSSVTQPAELTAGTQFLPFYNMAGSNSLDLTVTPTSYSSTLSSSTTNAKEVANVLDQLLGVNQAGTATAAQDSLLYAVSGQTSASLPGFAQSLSGEIHAASAATLPQTTQRVQQAVLARLGDFPMAPNQLNGGTGAGGGNAATPLSAGAITGNNPSGLPTANMSSNPAVNPNSANLTSAAVADGRAWGEIAYQRGERSGNSGGNGFNNNLYQAVFGVDAYTNAELGLKLGGGLALSNTTVNATGGNSTIQQGALFLYGNMPVAEDYVLDGMVSLGLSSTNLSRSDVTGISSGFSNKSVMGNDVLVSAGLSRPFETSAVRITPYVRLTYQYVGQAAYDEGATAAALTVGRMNANGVRGVIGVGAGSLNKDPLKDEYTYRANLAIGADSQGLLNPTLNTTLGGYSSSVTTPAAGSTFVQAGLYGTVKVADSAYAYAGVSAEARTGQTLYGGSVGLRVAF